jgi:uncharacterized phiE125 gp8 family phage protein
MEYYKQIDSASAPEPISLMDAKWHLRVLHNDEDTYITKLIVSARKWAESYTNRDWKQKSWQLLISNFKQEIEVRRYPVKTIDEIKLKLSDNTEKLLDENTDYRFYPSNSGYAKIVILNEYNLADVNDAISILFTTDIITDSEDGIAAMLLKLGSLYDIRIDTKKEYATAAENLIYPYRLNSML